MYSPLCGVPVLVGVAAKALAVGDADGGLLQAAVGLVALRVHAHVVVVWVLVLVVLVHVKLNGQRVGHTTVA